MYVDDLSVGFAASCTSVAEKSMQLAFDWVSCWAGSHGFCFSPAKTVGMHFSHLLGHLTISRLIYARSSDTLCTGESFFVPQVWYSSDLPIPIHLRSLAYRVLNLLRVLSQMSWEADLPTLLRLYCVLIRTKLDYVSEVYPSAIAARLNILDIIYHAKVQLRKHIFPQIYVACGDLTTCE